MGYRVIAGVAAGVLSLAVASSPARAAGPWGDSIVAYEAGVGATFTDPGSALGIPTRFTGVGVFPGAVTPFNPPYLGSEIVSIGRGGQITVAFDEPITDDPLNPFGLDLLVFGNTFYTDVGGTAGGLFGSSGIVEVSGDGVVWFQVAGVVRPTLGYSDLTDRYAPEPGNVPSEFTRPVDPGFDAMGRSFLEIVAAYDGSGGGLGIDIGAVGGGLGAVSFVRVSHPVGGAGVVSIDGFADVSAVPGPGMLAMVMLGALARGRRARR